MRSLLKRVHQEHQYLQQNAYLVTMLLHACRKILPVRHIDHDVLPSIAPSYSGYLKILKYYFFSDTWFKRLRGNVAILAAHDVTGRSVYNTFAVSGENTTAGAPLVPDFGPLYS